MTFFFFLMDIFYTLTKVAESNSLRHLPSTTPFQLSYAVTNLDNPHFPGYLALLDGTLDSTKQP